MLRVRVECLPTLSLHRLKSGLWYLAVIYPAANFGSAFHACSPPSIYRLGFGAMAMILPNDHAECHASVARAR
jgi:hypothetical protein